MAVDTFRYLLILSQNMNVQPDQQPHDQPLCCKTRTKFSTCWSLQLHRGISDPGTEPYAPRVRRDLDVVARGNSRSALTV